MSKIKESLKQERVKSYMSVSRDYFPIRYCFENKEYDIHYTLRGGLIMTGVKKIDNDLTIDRN